LKTIVEKLVVLPYRRVQIPLIPFFIFYSLPKNCLSNIK
jgi:hypothetical protein